MEFIALVILLGVIIYLFHLKGTITSIKWEIEQLKKGRPATQGVVAEAQSQQSQSEATQFIPGVPPVVGGQSSATPDHYQYTPQAPNAFVEWLKEDFLVKLGAFLLLIAFGWFVSYAFANNWIGPMGRIALGLITGVGIMGLGVWRIQTREHQGAIFSVLGSTIVLLTVFAARGIYDFFTPATALAIMFMAVVFVAYMSVQYKRESLALAGLLMASVAPLLTSTPEPSMVGLLSYLLVVVLGTLWVVRITGSNTLTFAALIVISFYSAPSMLGFISGDEKMIGLFFAFTFTAIFFVTNIISILHKQDESARKGHIMTALVTGLYLMSWIAFVAPEEWQSLLYIAWMLVFSAGAFVVYMHTNDRVPFYIYGAVGVGLLAAATAAELDGALLSIAYTVEAGAIVMLASALFTDRGIVDRISLLFIAPVLLSFEHLASSAWRDGFIHVDFFALVILMFTLLVVGLSLYGKRAVEKSDDMDSAIVLSVIGIMYFLALVWLVLHSILSNDTATMLSLLVYTVIGISLYIRGQHESNASMKIAGGILLGLVVARLLLVEVWQMELAGRIVTFFAIGILLISTAFIGKKKTENENITE